MEHERTENGCDGAQSSPNRTIPVRVTQGIAENPSSGPSQRGNCVRSCSWSTHGPESGIGRRRCSDSRPIMLVEHARSSLVTLGYGVLTPQAIDEARGDHVRATAAHHEDDIATVHVFNQIVGRGLH